jgi:protein-disulfide isomerase
VAPVKGPKTARVTIVEWADYQCPFCSRFSPLLDKLSAAYPNDLRVVFKQFPIPYHKNAHVAAEAALAAKAQGKFWEMHSKLFANQQALDRPSLERYAEEIGLDLPRFRADLTGQRWQAQVDAEMKEGLALGVQGTPWCYVNGKALTAGPDFNQLKASIDAALAEANALVKKGVPVDKLYDHLMAKAGTK